MAGEFKSGADSGADLTPPRLAERLMTAAVSAPDRAALIGDLHEEFSRLSRRSPNEARAWYWRQTAQSAPHLFWKRLRSPALRNIAVAAAATLGAFILIALWDGFIARNAARGFANLTQATDFTLARAIYLGVQMIGVAFGGAMIAYFTFDRSAGLIKNYLTRLTPAALVILAPTLIEFASPANTYPATYQLLWTALAIPSLVAGAAGAVWLFSKRR